MRPVLIAAAGALALSACTTMAIPGPVTTFARADCSASPDLYQAVSLTPDRERVAHNVATVIGAASPCLTTAAGTVPYALFALPQDYGDKTVIAGGALEQQRILAASVVTLDAYGQVVRAFQPSEFFFRGGSYSVQFRPRENEAYVMVSVDPTLVGQVYSAVNIGTGTSGTYAAGVYASWTYGMDQSQLRTFSYEGTAAILVNDSDTDEEG